MASSDRDPLIEEQEALAKRAARKAAKKKNAKAREVFLAARSDAVDHSALRTSMKLLLEGSQDLDTDDEDTQAVSAAITPQVFPTNNLNRWVPIGPSAVRRGQAEGGPRISGRVRDLAVSPNGQRAYAATAKGGVWYSGNGGATWEPLGGWANEPRGIGGNVSSFASACLLVAFGATAANDFVMVGTGELGIIQVPIEGPVNAGSMRGLGILVAASPASQLVQTDPWEAATGRTLLEGHTIVRMVRVPGSNAGQNGDQVIAATSGGLFLGTRAAGSFSWSALPSPGAPPVPTGSLAARDPTDLIFVGTRLFICFRSSGVAISDNITNPGGPAYRWVTMAAPAGNTLIGRMSIAVNDDNNTVYVLGELNTAPANPNRVAQIWQISNPGVAAPTAPAATQLAGVPPSARLWGGQRDYDQAIVATTYTYAPPPAFANAPPPVGARVDRVYIGGSLVGGPAVGGAVAGLTNWNASLWSFDVRGAALVPSPSVSDVPANTTHGADLPGLIGNAVHPDVHAISKATNADGSRQIWVGCDGGVFASLSDGRSNTFQARNVGLASIEVGFVASHPTSSHFAILGCQDNGRQVRVGESVWEVKANMQNDGGGVIFHPVNSHFVMGQFANASWDGDPEARYRAPLRVVVNDPESADSSFYSGISAITQPSGNRARIALGTNRVWVTDNLGNANRNTWRVLPIAPGLSRDPRPGARNPNAANQLFGVPLPLVPPPAGPPFGQLGPVVTVKWVNPTTLLALYSGGVVRYVENPAASNNWTSTLLFTPATVPVVLQPATVPPVMSVIPQSQFFTDIEPVPGTNDFYLSCSGATTRWRAAVPATPTSPAVPAVRPTADTDTCYYFDNAAGGFRATGLTGALPPVPPFAASPIDPAYSVVIDPANPNNVYVGTVTGVWQATKNPANNMHGGWSLFANGLPEAVVQDLTIWQDPSGAANSPRLLRAAIQSRGVWEVNLANQEPSRTYLRVHARDDRRMFPTPLKNPRRRPNAPDVSTTASPDITIRPESPLVNTPAFPGSNLRNGRLKYQLWTFQTAFRWIFPSVVANGEWTDQFGDLVERYRLANTPPLTARASSARRRTIDRELWNHVMANPRAQDEAGNNGVYRAPWQNGIAPNLPATEIDLIESVVPRRNRNHIWQIYRERCMVDVLLHHRDTRPVAANGASVVLLWQTNRRATPLRALDCSGIPAYVQSLFNGPAIAQPVGWNVAITAGSALHSLAVSLGARMPRAVTINLDLSAIPNRHHVMLIAIAGSTIDPCSVAPTGPIDRVDRFVRNWPHAAARLIRCSNRPGNPLH